MKRRIALLVVPLLLLVGCVGLEKPNETPAADVQPAATADEDPAAAPTSAPAPAPASPTPAPAPSTNKTAGTPPATQESAPAPAPRIEVSWWNGSTTSAGLGSVEPQPGLCCLAKGTPDESATRFSVPEGAKGVVVELIWSDEAIDLDLRVAAADYAPPDPTGGGAASGHAWSNAEGAPSQPDNHATILVTDPEALAAAGEWSWQVFGKGVAPQAAFQVAVSVFLDEAPAEGYQAAAE